MKSNETLQKQVQDAIKWEPLLNASEIGVTAKDGVITLSGTVDSYAKKLEAETAAKNVDGVRAVAENIQIHFENSFSKNDTEIANEVIEAWSKNWNVPEGNLKVKVENGWVTIEGDVEWNYQKEAAKKSVEILSGVKGVSNSIFVKSSHKDDVEASAIEKAFQRSWSINDNDINVKVLRNNVKLTGSVKSLYQRDEAGRLAWNTPGVWSVDNELCVV